MINHQLNFSSIRLKPLAICKIHNTAQVCRKSWIGFIILVISAFPLLLCVFVCLLYFVFLSKWDAFLLVLTCFMLNIIIVIIQKLIRMFCDCFRILLIDSTSASFFNPNNVVSANICWICMFFVVYRVMILFTLYLIYDRLSHSIVCFTIFDCIFSFV